MLSKLQSLFPSTNSYTLETYVDPLIDTFNKYDISTSLRQAGFMAQVGHESSGLRIIKENLNYSVSGLKSVFKKYFPGDLAYEYARNPEMIANRVYANRMGNGNEDSGDGWRYKGRGLIQITGKNNYSDLANEFNMNLEDVPDWLETPEGASLSAGWFWNSRGINEYADMADIIEMTKLVNGGLNGIDDREAIYKKSLTVF